MLKLGRASPSAFAVFGIALLVCSLVLVPSPSALASMPGGPSDVGAPCTGLNCDPQSDCFNNDPGSCSHTPNCDTTQENCGGCVCLKIDAHPAYCACEAPIGGG